MEGEGGIERFYMVGNTAAASELRRKLFFEWGGGFNAATEGGDILNGFPLAGRER